jgi:hypothetical protein
MIPSPCAFLGEPDQVRAGDIVMVPDLGPTHEGKEALGVISACVVQRICFPMEVAGRSRSTPGGRCGGK